MSLHQTSTPALEMFAGGVMPPPPPPPVAVAAVVVSALLLLLPPHPAARRARTKIKAPAGTASFERNTTSSFRYRAPKIRLSTCSLRSSAVAPSRRAAVPARPGGEQWQI